ncbi:hypothetical protein HBI23_220590 [Parastagonospora nodorum]|nr:hypothetical protein HBI23_220590 [Parastagonospora nodorum]
MLQIYCIIRYTNNARNTSQTYEPRRYAGSNKETPAPSRTKHCRYAAHLLNTEERTAFCAITTLCTPLLVCSSIATTPCRSAAQVTAAYALNYLELQVLKLTLIGIVLYNAIKEYYDDGIRKIIYFYSYTVEKDYNRAGKREDNILTIDECRTSHSNKKDIEADEREEETRVRLRKLLEEIHDILLREFRRANDFTESVTHNDDEQELELEDCDALVKRYEEEINCSNLYSTM